jgi:hypothetical protein
MPTMIKPEKKRSVQDLTLKGKAFVAGIVTASVIFAVAMPYATRMGFKANIARQSCAIQIQEKTEAIAKEGLATGDTIADAELGRKAAQSTFACQTASKESRIANSIYHWIFPAVAAVLLLSLTPVIHSVVRRIINRYRDYLLWR